MLNRHVSIRRIFWKIGAVTLIMQTNYNNIHNDNNQYFKISGTNGFLTEVWMAQLMSVNVL